MPIDYKKYPANWKTEIVPSIKERDGHRCRFCGIQNYAIIRIHPFKFQGMPLADIIDEPPFTQLKATMGADAVLNITDKEASRFLLQNMKQGMDCQIGGFRYVQIVLTCMHLDHDITNNDYSNLAMGCQRCHLRYDAEHHANNAKATRKTKLQAQTGQIDLFGTNS